MPPWSLDDPAQSGMVVKTSGPSPGLDPAPSAGALPLYDSWNSLAEKMQNSLTLGNPLAVLGYISAQPSKGQIFQLETTPILNVIMTNKTGKWIRDMISDEYNYRESRLCPVEKTIN